MECRYGENERRVREPSDRLREKVGESNVITREGNSCE